MKLFDLIKIHSLMAASAGNPKVAIGLIDGPVDFDHPSFQDSIMRTVNDSQKKVCKMSTSIACTHGTFIAGILSSKRGSYAPGICPLCEIVLRPIFAEDRSRESANVPTSSPHELSDAIIDCVKAGVRIINLSLGLNVYSLIAYPNVQEACHYALKNGVIIITAAGNQGDVGYTSLLNYPWIIPVAACDQYGRLSGSSNIGPSIGRRGVLAPGINITSTSPGVGYTTMSGTSVAVPFVTGTLALLWSLLPKANAEELIFSVRNTQYNRTNIIPPLLDGEAALEQLKLYGVNSQ
jgi:subtilisin family serine protease